jgi:hypothetical protein
MNPHPNTPKHEDRRYVGDCGTCGRPMRHVTVRAADAPGTIARQNDNECKVCALNAARARAAADAEAAEIYRTPEAKLQHMADWRAKYEADRAARGIPRIGYPQQWERVDRLDPDKPPYADARGPQAASSRRPNLPALRNRANA